MIFYSKLLGFFYFYLNKAQEFSEKADVEVSLQISFKKQVKSFFSKGSIFEKNLKPRVKNILGKEYKFEDEQVSSEIKTESVGVQCSLPIDKELKLSAPRESLD